MDETFVNVASGEPASRLLSNPHAGVLPHHSGETPSHILVERDRRILIDH